MRLLFPLLLLLCGASAAAQNPAEPADAVQSADAPVYLIADPMPTVDGMDVAGFQKWVVENLNFSELLFTEEVIHRMAVSMVVEPDGTLSDVQVANCPDERVKA